MNQGENSMPQTADQPVSVARPFLISTVSFFHTLGALHSVLKDPKCIEDKEEFLKAKALIAEFRKILPRGNDDSGSIAVRKELLQQANILIREYGAAADPQRGSGKKHEKQHFKKPNLKLVSTN